MPRPSLGLILPATTQGELQSECSNTLGTTNGAAELAELCRRAEATGADSLWAVDHLYWPHPIGEALTTLAVAAAATTRPTLGTCVLQLPLRQPAAVAKQATALQLLSGGRFVLGLGVGSHEEEYERAGVDFHRRGRLMDEGVAGLREAWAAPGPDSDYVQEPAGPPVPLWFGGASAAARRRAAAVGDGWIPLFIAPDEYAPAVAALRREAAEAGRDPGAVEPGVVVFACVGDDDAARPRRSLALAALPAAGQGLPAPPGGGVAGRVRRRAAPLRRGRRAPHRRHGGRLTRRRALRPRCAPPSSATQERVLTGAPA